MTKDEALKLALEALEYFFDTATLNMDKAMSEDAITAIKEALAQPEQEPVAWSYWQSCLNDDGTQTAPWVHRLSKFKPSESIINKDIVPLYTTPPQRKPLTRGQIREIEVDASLNPSFDYITPAEQLCRAIEAAHGIKEQK